VAARSLCAGSPIASGQLCGESEVTVARYLLAVRDRNLSQRWYRFAIGLGGYNKRAA
jgi:hypothetical protein